MSRAYRHLVYADDACLLVENVIMVRSYTEIVLVGVNPFPANVENMVSY